MGAQLKQTENSVFDAFMSAADRGEVLVADVFAALRRGEISEEQCKIIIAAFEKARVPMWRRILVSSH